MNVPNENECINETFKEIAFEEDALTRHSFQDCKFFTCRFDKTDFTASDFLDCSFEHCELNLPRLTNCRLRGATFKDSKLVGVDFTKCNPNFLRLAFENCLIDTCNFSGLKLKATPFPRCIIREIRFVESALDEACFDGCDLENTIFHQCNLQKTSFINAINYWIDPTANKLKGAAFSLPEATSLLTGLGIKLV